jgi:hypothetical protein
LKEIIRRADVAGVGGQNLARRSAALVVRKFCVKFRDPTFHSAADLVFLWAVGETTIMDACIVLGVASLAIALLLGSAAFAQTPPASTKKVVTINTANKFQQILASGTTLRMLRIGNNNNDRDSCWVFVGSGQASKEGSYAVLPGQEYLRYPPFVTSDAIQATCASSSDTLDVEYQ